MAKVTVYNVKVYDIHEDASKISRRMVTREGAKIMCGTIIGKTEIQIDETQLEYGEQWTPRDFKP